MQIVFIYNSRRTRTRQQ